MARRIKLGGNRPVTTAPQIKTMKESVVKDQKTKNAVEGSCFYGLIKECSMRGSIRMAIYGGGETLMDAVIENGVITLDGAELSEQEAKKFVSRHRADIERLLFEAARAHSEEKEYRRERQIASLADKAGEKGRWARIAIRDGKKTKILLIGRKGDTPEFMIDGKRAERGEAVHLIRENYEQFNAGLHDAERELRNDLRGREEARRKIPYSIVPASDGEVRVDLRKRLPAKEKVSPDLKKIRKITGKHFNQMHTRSHLKD